jgi:hypothetical protein
MKNLLLIVAALGVMLFTSCEEEVKEEQKEEVKEEQKSPKPFPVGTWHTTHQYFKRTTNAPEDVHAQKREKEASANVTEAESYQLTFKDGGTGSGSGFVPDGKRRYSFGFRWKLSDDRIDVYGAGFYPAIVFRTEDYFADRFSWILEESSADRMVLFTEWYTLVDSIYGGGWEEHGVCRYTFERVKE